MIDYYDRRGRGLTTDEYLALDKSWDYRNVDQTEVEAAEARVSTIWLGLDHRHWGSGGAPLIFETKVFGGECDQDCERWSTEAEARAGHGRYVDKVTRAAADLRALARRSDVIDAVQLLASEQQAYRQALGDVFRDEAADFGRLLRLVELDQQAASVRPTIDVRSGS